MKEPTKEQVRLGWEHIDLSQHFFFCMVQVEDRAPVATSGHKSLTPALHACGNMARDWEAEGNTKKEEEPKTSRWQLEVEGHTVKIFPQCIAKESALPVEISKRSVAHEAGRIGHSEKLLAVVRQQANQAFAARNAAELVLPEEVSAEAKYHEGAVRLVTVNAYERNAQARSKCIARYGAYCGVCAFDFGKKYGQVGAGFIHVHHLKPLADIGERYEVDPITDLRPVCPDCHAIIHRRNPPYTIEEVQGMLK